MQDLLLPLFPLGIVLLPQELLPLHIFEERYKEMIGECLEAKRAGGGDHEFGILQVQREKISTVGCTARIVNVTRRYTDGRLDILSEGSRRFEVLLTNEEKSYLRGAVDYFDDDPSADTPEETDVLRATELFTATLRRLRRSPNIPVHLPPPHRHLSFRIAGSLPLDPGFKQDLLSIRNETDRLNRVMETMIELIERLGRVEKAQQRAGGNGHGYDDD